MRILRVSPLLWPNKKDENNVARQWEFETI